MRKIHIVGLALIAVFAFSAIAAGSASATKWLKGGAELLAPEASTSHGTIILHHEGGLAGTLEIECTGLFVGTSGPGATDKVTGVENLTGTEKNPINCKNKTGCEATVKVTAENLPWNTELKLEGSPVKTFDVQTGAGGKAPGYETQCNAFLKGLCAATEKPEFKSNGTNGAIFEYTRAAGEASCSDGGKGWITGSGEVLGLTVS